MNQPSELPAQSSAKTEQSGWRVVWDWAKALIIALLIAFGIKHFLFTQRIVSGPSMNTTLATGDRMVIDRIPYDFALPKRGDIIVFQGPDGKQWVKRVIGLPGDTVRVFKGQLYLNGQVIQEPFIDGPMDPTKNYGPTLVPPNQLYVMGDNRNISYDSRYIGPIGLSTLTGRVDAVIWPLNVFHIFGTTQEHFFPQGDYIHHHYVIKAPY